jgi:hypothetical protein
LGRTLIDGGGKIPWQVRSSEMRKGVRPLAMQAGTPVAKICRKPRISQATYFNKK